MREKKVAQLLEKVAYNGRLDTVGGSTAIPFGILLKSYSFLEQLVRKSPKNSIKMDIPETLIMSYEAQIHYVFTNSSGYLETKSINAEPAVASLGCKFSAAKEASTSDQSLNERAIQDLIKIANYFHDCIYLRQPPTEKAKIFPIAIVKTQGDANDNCTQLVFFTNGILDYIIKNHQREHFIIQRFIPAAGLCPALIRCELAIKRFPTIDFQAVEKQLEPPAHHTDDEEDSSHRSSNIDGKTGSSKMLTKKDDAKGKLKKK